MIIHTHNKKFEKSYKLAATTTPRVILVMSTQLSDRVATRIQELKLWTSRIKLHEVMKITGLTSVALYKIKKRAIDRDFNPKIDSKILASYVKDTPQSGRPGIPLKKHNEVIAKATQVRFGCEKST